MPGSSYPRVLHWSPDLEPTSVKELHLLETLDYLEETNCNHGMVNGSVRSAGASAIQRAREESNALRASRAERRRGRSADAPVDRNEVTTNEDHNEQDLVNETQPTPHKAATKTGGEEAGNPLVGAVGAPGDTTPTADVTPIALPKSQWTASREGTNAGDEDRLGIMLSSQIASVRTGLGELREAVFAEIDEMKSDELDHKRKIERQIDHLQEAATITASGITNLETAVSGLTTQLTTVLRRL